VSAAADVAAERARQDAKWGEQHHPDGTGPDVRPLAALVANAHAQATAPWLAARAPSITDTKANAGQVTWRDILLEEVFEALAEDDPAHLRTELVQVAAVAQQWAEAIDRRAACVEDQAAVDAEVERCRAGLLEYGYVEVDDYQGLRRGVRVHHRRERFGDAYQNGTGTVAAVFRKDNSSWSRSWGVDDVELLVVRDSALFGARVSQLAQYHVHLAGVARG
jgi:hypothetical protein